MINNLYGFHVKLFVFVIVLSIFLGNRRKIEICRIIAFIVADKCFKKYDGKRGNKYSLTR